MNNTVRGSLFGDCSTTFLRFHKDRKDFRETFNSQQGHGNKMKMIGGLESVLSIADTIIYQLTGYVDPRWFHHLSVVSRGLYAYP